MARTRQLSELRDEVRQRADIENSTHFSDAEITRYINQSIARLYGKVASELEEDFAVTASLSTVAGTTNVDLPGDFWRMGSFPPYIISQGRAKRLHRFQPQDVPALIGDPTRRGEPSWYRLTSSDSISLLPVPDAVYTLNVWYIPAAEQLSADGDTFDGRNGWEEWVVLDAAIKCLVKEESDCTALVAERDSLWHEIAPQAAAKDASRPDRAQDVEGRTVFWQTRDVAWP